MEWLMGETWAFCVLIFKLFCVYVYVAAGTAALGTLRADQVQSASRAGADTLRVHSLTTC